MKNDEGFKPVDKRTASLKEARVDLSDVALNGMVQQARNAGVPMADVNAELRTVSRPILHDETIGVEQDREVRYPDAPDAPNPLPTQRTALIEGMTYQDSLQFIDYFNPNQGERAGTVDMDVYNAWLRANYGFSMEQ